MTDRSPSDVVTRIRVAAADEELVKRRNELAQFMAETFAVAGTELHAVGHFLGPDRVDGVSPWGHGSDETVAISLLLRIAAQLMSASVDLFADGRAYAAAALLRQLVEIEYLAWAMETRDRNGERWLRSDRKERQSFFSPAKLRAASNGQFRWQDYSHHCELGGHPVPGATALLGSDPHMSQLLLSDLLGHAGHIWNHIVGWARQNSHSDIFYSRNEQLTTQFAEWTRSDPIADLPMSPDHS